MAADFSITVPSRDVRTAIRDLTGADPGFDIGADAFSAMLGLAISEDLDPIVPSVLLARFAADTVARRSHDRYSYFVDTPQFAADTDCTALASSALYEHGSLSAAGLGSAAKELLKAATPRGDVGSAYGHRPGQGEVRPGVVTVYWDDDVDPRAAMRGRKYDPVVCANALYTLALAQDAGVLDRNTEVPWATARYVEDHLASPDLSGTRYYPDPHAFLFAVSRLCGRFDAYAELFGRDLGRHFARKWAQAPGNPLSVAQLILTAYNLGFPAEALEGRLRVLALSQRTDGSWPAATYYRMGRYPVYFGSPLVTTLFAVRALQEPHRMERP
ncbi:hypothetical protein [Streptomyces sp. NPDC087856]|uniref:hypothetical protein n=1 Tax=Streptomyces sp. NPDC087856 TaxID=3365811 RepID=UPI00382DD0A3